MRPLQNPPTGKPLLPSAPCRAVPSPPPLTLRLLTANPRTEAIDGRMRTVVYLFGRSADGRSFGVRTPPLAPWLQVVEPSDEVARALPGWEGVVAVADQELWVDGAVRRCLRIETERPGQVPGLRERLQSRGLTVLAADIPFHHRYLYDRDLGGCISVAGGQTTRAGWSCPVIDATDLATAETIAPTLRTLSFDIENSLQDRRIFCICYTVREAGATLAEGRLRGDEPALLREFVAAVAAHDPDVLTGYNIDGYDLPLLRERADLLRVPLTLGRDGTELEGVRSRLWRVAGRVVADAWWNVKREVRPRQESLNAVARQLLDRAKHDVNPQEIDAEWQRDPDRVVEYCLEDARLAGELLEHIGVLAKYQHLGSVAKLPLDEVLNGRTSTLIDSLMIRAADRRGIGVPLTRHERRTGHIEGGYVHAIAPGLYHWVCVLDFKSMYPSIIIDRNLCFTTLDDDGETLTPHGVRFLAPARRKGLLPELLTGLMADRDAAQARQRSATDDAEREHFQRVQEAIKILMNSVYGVFASYFYRFTNRDIGASITAYAREQVRNIIAALGEQGVEVLYGDTDSVFVIAPHDNLAATVEFGERLAARYSRGARRLEFEKVLEPFFSHGVKKRYVGRVVWPGEGMLVRGYETRRSDAFPAQVAALEAVFARLLAGETDGALQVAREEVGRVAAGNAEPAEMVITKTVNPDRQYKNRRAMAHMQAYDKYMKTGRPFVSGMKVAFIVTDADRTPMEVEPYYPDMSPPPPDYGYYAERVATSLARITEVFGWDARALRVGHQQATLYDALATTAGPASPEPAAAVATPAAPPADPPRKAQPRQQRLF